MRIKVFLLSLSLLTWYQSQGRKPNFFQFLHVINSGKPSCDRISFRSPSPDPKAFRSVESSSKNIHHRRLFRRTFPTTSFSHTARSAWRRSPIFPKAPKPENHPHAFFRPATASHAPAREPLSGDALPPPASPDAD